MARKKVALQRIANDATRRATFKKRRKGLMKKASELATLCDVDACVVVYGAGESQPEVWPEAPDEAERVISRFKEVPELDQCKKMMDMEGYLNQSIVKLREQLHKAQRETREREMKLLMHDAIAGRRPGLLGLSVEEVVSLGTMVETRIQAVRNAIGRLHGEGQELPPAMAPSPATGSSSLTLASYSTGASAGVGHRDMMQPAHLPPWLMAGGDTGALGYGGFGGAGTSAGADMAPQQFGSMGIGFAWPAAGQSFPSM